MIDDQDAREAAYREQQASRRPVSWSLLLGVLGIVVAVAVGWVVWHAAQPDERSTAPIERQIAAGLTKQVSLTDVVVHCPDPIEWRVGEDFHCVASAKGAPRIPVTVTMENDKGAVTWRAE